MVKKTINFEYYQLTEFVSDSQNEALFDLEKWISETKELSLQDKTRKYKSDYVRVEDFDFDPRYEAWFLKFIRQRYYDVPELSTDETQSEFMTLDKDQYVTEPITCLYDSETHVLMVEKNQHSVSIVGLENYINQTIPDDIEVNLRKIVSKNSFQKALNAQTHRSITVRLADLDSIQENNFFQNFRSSIGDMISGMKSIPAPYLELNFSVGRKRNMGIDDDESKLILQDIEKNKKKFDKARVRMIEDEEAKVETINLFLDSEKDSIDFDVSERNDPIRFDVMITEMGELYFNDGRKMEISKNLNYGE